MLISTNPIWLSCFSAVTCTAKFSYRVCFVLCRQAGGGSITTKVQTFILEDCIKDIVSAHGRILFSSLYKLVKVYLDVCVLRHDT